MVSADERVEHISIHALRGEGDVQLGKLLKRLADFNPRPPWGGRQSDVGELPGDIIISIHALRGEGDIGTGRGSRHNRRNFNPRPPWGGRPIASSCVLKSARNFNPRPPWGGRHRYSHRYRYQVSISIHALRGEGDVTSVLRFISLCANFNPRPPWGGRLIIKILQVIVNYFNPRPPWGGRRHSSLGCRYSHGISIHALRGEGDDAQPGDAVKRNDFNPRPPWGGRQA